MKNKLVTLCFTVFIVNTLFCQQNVKGRIKKCKPVFDKEIGRDNYTDVETQPVFADTTITELILITEDFKFKVPAKNHKDNEWVKFSYMIEKDGKSTFLKVLDPINDKEVENEAKRIVSLMPLYMPATCTQEPVPTRMNIRFKIHTY
ncbi:MAG TPA: hypothetical protein VF868_00330 [Bacteroidia bacterium]|jgi:hypothetical protein